MEYYEDIISEVNQKLGTSFQKSSKDFSQNNRIGAVYSAFFVGEYLTHGIIIIALKKDFPYTLPEFYLERKRTERRLHVSVGTGKICYSEESSILTNTESPAQIIIECLELVDHTLSLQPGTPEYKEELRKEFLSYWGKEDCYSIYSLEDVLDYKKTKLFIYGENLRLLAVSRPDIECFWGDHCGLPISELPVKEMDVFIVRLTDRAEPLSPFRRYDWRDICRYIKTWTDNETWKKFEIEISKKVSHYFFYLFFILPEKNGHLLFGISVQIHNRRQLQIKASKTDGVRQVRVIRKDYDYLLSRGGARPSLKDKRVLLLGCGSLGGFVANNLCQIGVTKLDLIDNDEFKYDNIYRHFMGFDAIKMSKGKSGFKSDLLSTVLNEKYAYLDIDPMNYNERSVEQIVLKNPEILKQYDLVISALGEPTLNLAVNDLLIEHQIPTPFIVCFNEPYGIGGHVITTNITRDSCLRCYYTAIPNGGLCAFRPGLTAPDQSFKKTLSGCSGAFVPYSSLDSQQTAVFTVRKAIDVLTGKQKSNDLFTWRGNPEELLEQGYHYSNYFNMTTDPSSFSNPCCPTCNKRRKQHDLSI